MVVSPTEMSVWHTNLWPELTDVCARYRYACPTDRSKDPCFGRKEFLSDTDICGTHFCMPNAHICVSDAHIDASDTLDLCPTQTWVSDTQMCMCLRRPDLCVWHTVICVSGTQVCLCPLHKCVCVSDTQTYASDRHMCPTHRSACGRRRHAKLDPGTERSYIEDCWKLQTHSSPQSRAPPLSQGG